MGLPSVGMGQNAGPMKVIKAARVLRPLKLVSGVPSRFNMLIILVYFSGPIDYSGQPVTKIH